MNLLNPLGVEHKCILIYTGETKNYALKCR